MLRLEVKVGEDYDDAASKFVPRQVVVLELEHSLLSLSKWETEWEIPFLDTVDRTEKQTRSYIRAMCLREIPDDEVLDCLTEEQVKAIGDYINKRASASWVAERGKPPRQEMVTSELIYYWMTALDIWKECETWHLNRLLMLIRIANAKNAKQEKMSPEDVARQNRELNAQRRKEMGSAG